MHTVFIYFSDLHLEFIFKDESKFSFIYAQIDEIKAKYPDHKINILAAGDIAKTNKSYTYKFFDTICGKVDEVFYVFGNHEFYDGFLKNERERFQRKYASRIPNLYVMEDAVIEYERYVVIGSTLWTSYNNGALAASMDARSSMNDYKYIRYDKKNPRTIKTADIIGINYDSEQFIFNSIAKYSNTDKKIIVMTHHAPVNPDPSHTLRNLDWAFYNNFEKRLSYEVAPDYWVYGHTHDVEDFMIGDLRVLTNAIGYCDGIRNETLRYFII